MLPLQQILLLPALKNTDKRSIIIFFNYFSRCFFFATENQVINGLVISSPQNVCVGGCHNGGCFCLFWLQKTVYEPFSGEREIPFPSLNPHKDLSQNDVTCDSPSNSEAIHLFERNHNDW